MNILQLFFWLSLAMTFIYLCATALIALLESRDTRSTPHRLRRHRNPFAPSRLRVSPSASPRLRVSAALLFCLLIMGCDSGVTYRAIRSKFPSGEIAQVNSQPFWIVREPTGAVYYVEEGASRGNLFITQLFPALNAK